MASKVAAIHKVSTTCPVAVASTSNLNNPELYINRELSLLAFQRQVLEEAVDRSDALLERVHFLSKVGSNLNEFFMVRVAALMRQIYAGRAEVGPDGMTARRIISVVGRFLEHSRIYYFYNGGDEVIYVGSADPMRRNLSRRVEVLFPIEDRSAVRHLGDRVLELYLQDNVKAREMLVDGNYSRRAPAAGEPAVNAQEELLRRRAGSNGRR